MAISYTISYTFSPSTTISSSQVNTNFSDNSSTWQGIEAKTKTFSNLGVDTELKTGGSLLTANGTVAAPSISFTNSTGTGLYRIGADDLGVATAGVIALEVSNAQLITAYNNIVFSPTTKGIKGTTTNDAGTALNVGEYIETVISATNFPSTGTIGDLVTISLTAGDWDVSLTSDSIRNGSTWTSVFVGITSTAGNFSTGRVLGSNWLEFDWNGTSIDSVELSIPVFRVSLASTTTYYFKYGSTFSVATPQCRGRLSARRVR